MRRTFQISNIDSILESEKSNCQNWFVLVLTGNISEFRRRKRLSAVDYWWIDLDLETKTLYHTIAFDKFKRPISEFKDKKLSIRNVDYLDKWIAIDEELFNDMWRQHDSRDFKSLETLIAKYLNEWTNPKQLVTPKFPAILIDFAESNKYTLLENVNEIINDPDLFGYAWSETERLIDSKGDIYKMEYLNFGHPVGIVFPKNIDRRINQSELDGILNLKEIKFTIE